MTEQHCDHEEYCGLFYYDSKLAYNDGTRCMRNHDGCAKCSYDSRARNPPASTVEMLHKCPGPSRPAHRAGTIPRSEQRKYILSFQDEDPLLMSYVAGLKVGREEARKEERERVLNAIFNGIDCLCDPESANEKNCHGCTLAMTHVECHHGNVLDTREKFDGCLIESLRKGAP